MDPVFDYDSLMFRLKMRFQNEYAEDRRRIRMIGLCFARPASALAKNEIFPQIPDWHYRSGSHIDFFFPGFTDYSKEEEAVELFMPGRGAWFYSPEVFNTFRKQIEGKTRWKYSGGNDLILVNSRYREDIEEPEIDFSSAIVCQLDLMKDVKAFPSVEMYFESIFRFAEETTDQDPTWGFSDRMAGSLGGSALLRMALSLLPGGIGAEVEKAKHLAIKDIGLE
jgi:hypothetical protein